MRSCSPRSWPGSGTRRFDLDLLGFDASELERLLAPAEGETSEAEDEVPEPPVEPVTKPGDLWLLGDHRVLCGDATVLTDVERVLGGLARRHGLDRSALQCRLRQLGQGQAARQGPADPQRRPRRRLRGVPPGRLHQHPDRHQGCRLHLHEQLGAAHAAGGVHALPAASGRPSSSGPRTPSPSAAPTTSGSTSRSSMAGRRAPTTTGAGPGTRATSGSSTSRRRTTCTRR